MSEVNKLEALICRRDELTLHSSVTLSRLSELDKQIKECGEVFYKYGSVFQLEDSNSLFDQNLYWMISVNGQIYFLDLKTCQKRSEGFTPIAEYEKVSKSQIDSRFKSKMKYVRSQLECLK